MVTDFGRLREELDHLAASIEAENERGIGVSETLMSDMREARALLAETPAPLSHTGTQFVVQQSCPPHEWAHAPTVGYFRCSKCREQINYNDPRYAEMLSPAPPRKDIARDR